MSRGNQAGGGFVRATASMPALVASGWTRRAELCSRRLQAQQPTFAWNALSLSSQMTVDRTERER